MSDIFSLTTRPDPALFTRRNDPNDPRLGELVPADPAAYDQAAIVLLGCPQDKGVERNKGRIGASAAPDAIRQALYRMTAFDETAPRLFDLGNTLIQDSLEATHAVHHTLVRQVLRDGKQLMVLGGGNDVAYADCSALCATLADVVALNIDAHFDVRADEIPNSGTPYRQLLEGKHLAPTHFYEVAYQPFGNSPIYRRYLTELGVQHYSLAEVHERGLAQVIHAILAAHPSAEGIFWGLDMDVVRAADAPGVSAVNPTGLSGEEFCQIAYWAGQDARSKILEITEVNPTYDIDGRTARLAAAALYHFVLGVARRG